MKKITKYFFIILFVLSIFSVNVFAYSYEDAMKDYQEAWEDSQKQIDQINNSSIYKDSLTKSNRELWQIPDLSYEEFLVLYNRDEKEIEKVAKAVENPSLALIDTIGKMPFASDSKGGSCDKRVVFYDANMNRYLVIEYNSYYGEVLVTPQYYTADGYFFWCWLRVYAPSSTDFAHTLFFRAGASWYGSSITPDYGLSVNNVPQWAFYFYSFTKPVDYNASAEVMLGDVYDNTTKTGTAESIGSGKRVGNYYKQAIFRLFPVYIAPDTASSNTVAIQGHGTVQAMGGLLLYTDDPLTVISYQNTEPTRKQTIQHDGTIVGDVQRQGRGGNNYNIYIDYRNYIVNSYNYWLFANFVNQYEDNILGNNQYGLFQDFYDNVSTKILYLSQVVLPAGYNEIVQFVGNWKDTVNGFINLFITNTSSSVLWPLSALLIVAMVFLVIRILMLLGKIGG